LGNLLRHEHAPLALAQRCSGVPGGTPLFNALLNYRHAGGRPQADPDFFAAFGYQTLFADERTNYPLALAINDQHDGFLLTVQAASPISVGDVLDDLVQALGRLVDSRAQPHWGDAPIEVVSRAESRKPVIARRQPSATEMQHPTMMTLLEVWADCLQMPSITCNTDFFESGGDSITAIRLFSSLRGRRLELPLKMIYDLTTIQQQFDYLNMLSPER
jgi:aryl carrier-like protein